MFPQTLSFVILTFFKNTVVVIRSLSPVQFFVTQWTAAHQASLAFTSLSWNLLKLMFTESWWWCHPTISSSAVPFSPCLQSFPAPGSFPMSQFFASSGQNIGAPAWASVLHFKKNKTFLTVCCSSWVDESYTHSAEHWVGVACPLQGPRQETTQCPPSLAGAARFDHLVDFCSVSALDNYPSFSPLQLISSLRGWQDHWYCSNIRISPQSSVWIDDFWLIQYLPWWTNYKMIFQLHHSFHIYQSALEISHQHEPSLLLCVFIYLYIFGMNSWISFFDNTLLFITIFMWVLKQPQMSLVGGPSRWLLYPCNRSPVLWTLRYFRACLVPSLPYPWY